jgi:hypothetical protein
MPLPRKPKGQRKLRNGIRLAPQTGFEPRTLWLTAEMKYGAFEQLFEGDAFQNRNVPVKEKKPGPSRGPASCSAEGFGYLAIR